MPSPNQKVEATLADLAVNLVFERTPALADHYLGFELIPGTQNEENTRAAGLLGFRVGNEDIYIPVLFLSGKVKGTEVLYLKNADVFTSNSKQWVDYLTTSDTGVMGSGATPNTPIQQPSSKGLAVFSRAPGSLGKLGSFFDGAAADFWQKVASADENWSNIDGGALTLKKVLTGLGKKAYLQFMSTLDEHPKLLEKVANVFDLESEVFIHEWPEEKAAAAEPSESEKIAAMIEESATPIFLTSQRAEFLHKQGSITLSPPQLEKCFEDGFVIFDKRAEDETTLVLKEDFRHRFSHPQESGFYEIINSGGELERVLIAHSPFTIENPNRRMSGSLVLDPESGVYVLPVLGEQIFVRSRFSVDEAVWKEKFDKMPSISSMEVGKSYMLISPSMDVSAPFKVNGKTKGEKGYSFNCTTPYEITYRCVQPSSCGFGVPVCASVDGSPMSLRVVDREDEATVVSIGSITYAPSSWRVAEVYADSNGLQYDYGIYSTDSEDQKKQKAERDKMRKVYFRILPGTSQTVSAVLANKNIHELVVSKTASDYTISVDRKALHRGNKLASFQALVVELGLSQKNASQILDESVNQAGTKVWIQRKEGLMDKSAAGPDMNADGLIYGGMSFPQESPDIGVNLSGVTEVAPQVIREQVPLNNLGDPSQDWRNMDEANWDRIKQKDIDFLMRVADSGSKSVFETSVINLLLRSNRTSNRIAEWLPDLVSGLDTKARLLLSFYWHSAEFSQDYGKDEMAEFEDVLLDSIKIDGQLILFLKQRAGESSSSNIDAFAG